MIGTWGSLKVTLMSAEVTNLSQAVHVAEMPCNELTNLHFSPSTGLEVLTEQTRLARTGETQTDLHSVTVARMISSSGTSGISA